MTSSDFISLARHKVLNSGLSRHKKKKVFLNMFCVEVIGDQL